MRKITPYSFLVAHAVRYLFTLCQQKLNCFSLCLPYWLSQGLATIMITVHDQAAKKHFEFVSFLSVYCYHTGCPETTIKRGRDQHTQLKSKVVLRQVFTRYSCILILAAFVVLCAGSPMWLQWLQYYNKNDNFNFQGLQYFID